MQEKKERTYSQLEKEVKKAAFQLKSIGISKGDKVAILSTNMPNWGIAYFAIAVTGAVVVPILPDFHPNEIKNILKHAEVTAIYVSEGLAGKLSIDEYPEIQIIGIENFSLKNAGVYPPVKEETENFVFEDVDEEDMLSIIYTSGTTGKSKGVMLTHRNIVWDSTTMLGIACSGSGRPFPFGVATLSYFRKYPGTDSSCHVWRFCSLFA